jgi:hypothetical protein
LDRNQQFNEYSAKKLWRPAGGHETVSLLRNRGLAPNQQEKRTMRRWRMRTRVFAFSAAASMIGATSGCGAGAKGYDISPIFPLSSGKCAHYGGKEEGSGVTAKCMVTKEECEKAAADWKRAMQAGDVTEAVEFSCE